MAVHSTFSRNWILRSGLAISGSILQKGLMTSKNLTEKKGNMLKKHDLHTPDTKLGNKWLDRE